MQSPTPTLSDPASAEARRERIAQAIRNAGGDARIEGGFLVETHANITRNTWLGAISIELMERALGLKANPQPRGETR